MMYVQSSTLEDYFSSIHLLKGENFCAHHKYQVKTSMYKYDFVTSELVGKPIMVKYATLWKKNILDTNVYLNQNIFMS